MFQIDNPTLKPKMKKKKKPDDLVEEIDLDKIPDRKPRIPRKY